MSELHEAGVHEIAERTVAVMLLPLWLGRTVAAVFGVWRTGDDGPRRSGFPAHPTDYDLRMR